jgi:hypothetical protein
MVPPFRFPVPGAKARIVLDEAARLKPCPSQNPEIGAAMRCRDPLDKLGAGSSLAGLRVAKVRASSG